VGRVREGRAGGVLASRRADRNRISEAQHGDDRLFTPVISPVPIPTVLTGRLQQFAFKVQNHASTRRCVDCNSNRVMRSSSYRRWHQNCRTTSQARSGDSRQPPLPILRGESLCASSRPPETRHSKRAHPPGRRHVNILDLDSDPRRGTDASLCVGLRPHPPRVPKFMVTADEEWLAAHQKKRSRPGSGLGDLLCLPIVPTNSRILLNLMHCQRKGRIGV
jgi:hypothetical protein